MTKKLLGVAFASLCFITSASALTMTGSCTLTTGTDPAVNPGNNSNPNPVLSGAVFTCLPFTVPTGFTLNQVDISIGNDYSLGVAFQTNTVDFTYTVTGFSTTSVSTSVSGSGISSTVGGLINQTPAGDCVNTGTNSIDCTDGGLSILSPSVFGAVVVTGSSTWAAGGVGPAGSDQFNVAENFTYSPTGQTPEPASLLMIGGGLIGLALAGRRKFRA